MSKRDENKVKISITLDPDLLEFIEEIKGESPRATFINEILSSILLPRETYFKFETVHDMIKHRSGRFATMHHIFYEAVEDRLKDSSS